ncbi:MAG TPA: oxygen-independent coproporphyrinogen III oxidase [Gammaproteobacteria bacterium]|nr:oxygen-independent coproporphyrinogen III oxidase [Gammaproteobacteria bacterium]
MDQSLEFDRDLLRKYDISGPRYTSYPTAPQFHDGFGVADYREAAEHSNGELIPRPLSLYLHIPFCRTVCFYCGCNRVITGNYRHAGEYLARLEREIRLQAPLFDSDRVVEQLHFGGGTPTYLGGEDMARLMAALGQAFPLSREDGREFSIEIDPRTVSRGKVAQLAGLGFNRMSLGVQDFDPAVQAAVNRIQSVEQTAECIDAAREAGFGSVNLDLIYGLPRQTLESFERTLLTVLALRPERLAVYNYAHLPELFKVQRQIRAEEIPDPETKLALLELTIDRLTEAGYVYIGMDHFALPDDELSRAQRGGGLHRNFQGYSTHAECDLIGLGVSAIGRVGDTYSQNLRDLDGYYDALDSARQPLWRGIVLTADDRLRRDVINAIMCHSAVDFRDFERRQGIRFRSHFAAELEDLAPLAADGLVEIDDTGLAVTPLGRLLLRNVAMVFDAYLRDRARERPAFSRVI